MGTTLMAIWGAEGAAGKARLDRLADERIGRRVPNRNQQKQKRQIRSDLPLLLFIRCTKPGNCRSILLGTERDLAGFLIHSVHNGQAGQPIACGPQGGAAGLEALLNGNADPAHLSASQLA